MLMSRKKAVIAPAAIIVSVIGYAPLKNWFDTQEAKTISIDIIFAIKDAVFAFINMTPPYLCGQIQTGGGQG